MRSTHATNYVNVLDSDVFGFRHVKSLVISFVAVLYDRLGIGNLCSNFSWNKLGAPKSTMTTEFFVESCFFQLWKVEVGSLSHYLRGFVNAEFLLSTVITMLSE